MLPMSPSCAAPAALLVHTLTQVTNSPGSRTISRRCRGSTPGGSGEATCRSPPSPSASSPRTCSPCTLSELHTTSAVSRATSPGAAPPKVLSQVPKAASPGALSTSPVQASCGCSARGMAAILVTPGIADPSGEGRSASSRSSEGVAFPAGASLFATIFAASSFSGITPPAAVESRPR